VKVPHPDALFRGMPDRGSRSLAMTPAPEDYVAEERSAAGKERHATVRKPSDPTGRFYSFANLTEAQRYACEWAAVERVRAWTRLPGGEFQLIDCEQLLR